MARHLNPFLVLILAACGGDPLLERVQSATVTSGDLTLHTTFALPPFTDAPMPVYLTIENQAIVADTLLAVTSPASGMAMLHGGGMEMMTALPIPARGEVALRPGALHLMLDPPLDRDYVRGDSVAVTLRFARGAEVKVWAPVIDYDEVDVVTESP